MSGNPDAMTDFTLLQRLFAPLEVKRAEARLRQIRSDHDARLERIEKFSDGAVDIDELEMKMPDGSVAYREFENKIDREDIHADPDVQILNVELEEGVEFPLHYHDETEILSVIKGVMILEGNLEDIRHANCVLEGEKLVMGPASVAIIQPGSPHTVSVVEQARVMAMMLCDGDHDSLISKEQAVQDDDGPSGS